MKKRWIVIGGVLVAFLGISVASVAIHQEFLQDRWDASNASADLGKKLTALEGVKSAKVDYRPFALPNGTANVSVTFASDAEPENWGAAHSVVRDAASSQALQDTIVDAEFGEAGARTTATFDSLLLTPDTVASEIEAWRALREVVGDRVSLHLGSTSSSAGQLRREYRVSDAQEMHEIAALWTPDLAPSESSLPTHWIAPGMERDRMPFAAEMAALSAVADFLPLDDTLDPNQSGTVAAVIVDSRGFKVEITSLVGGGYRDLANDPLDKRVADAAQAALAAGAAEVNWRTATHGSTLIADECGTYTLDDGTEIATELRTRDDDKWFAAHLAELGFVMPADVRPGYCQPII